MISNQFETKTAVLTHVGRKSGRSFQTQIWFVEFDGNVWVATQDETRQWPRNIETAGQAELDRGAGPEGFSVERVLDPQQMEAYMKVARRKYPIGFRLIQLFVRNKTPAVFRLSSVSP